MKHTLITFLGRVPKDESGYRQTVYHFADGTQTEPVAFLGRSLISRVDCNRVVILGTRGSMWDHLFENDVVLGDLGADKRLHLIEQVENKAVSQSLLDELTPLLAEHYGCEVVLRMIPYCATAEEQSQLLATMADVVPPNATVSLDITHAFRHLPLFALISALHLRQLKNVHIEHLFYGFFDPDEKRGEVWELRQLMQFIDWLSALGVYQKTGNYDAFADLLPESLGQPLREASFFETIGRTGQAKSRLKTVLNRLAKHWDSEMHSDPVFSLFSDELQRRLQWANHQLHYQRQASLAREYLQRNQFRDAVLKGYEAFVSWLVQKFMAPNVDPDDYKKRNEVLLFATKEKLGAETYDAYRKLRTLRNAMAHETRVDDADIRSFMSSPEAMRSLIESLFEQLLPRE